jgi:hypothetical protein
MALASMAPATTIPDSQPDFDMFIVTSRDIDHRRFHFRLGA